MAYTWIEMENGMYRGYIEDKNGYVGRCGISYKDNVWTISEWFVHRNHMNKGYGKEVLKETAKTIYISHGKPKRIKYIWNGANEYVYDWMVRNFDAKCTCPIWEQKITEEDIWWAHEYELNPDKFIEYINK